METETSSKQKVKMEMEKDVTGDRNHGSLDSGGHDVKKKKKGGAGGGSSSHVTRCCQADNCTADLSEAKQYHRRHKVCELHAKAQAVIVQGLHQRFCQQCSRFHEVSEFDDAKRSCRRRLAGHNERRRKSSIEFKGTRRELVFGEINDR